MIKKNYKLVLSIISIVVISYPLVYNFQHPEITPMQLFLKFFWIRLPFLVVLFFCLRETNK